MTCPVCKTVMGFVVGRGCAAWWWCPQCGSLMVVDTGKEPAVDGLRVPAIGMSRYRYAPKEVDTATSTGEGGE